ncbi:MAG: hypothetical protein KDC98_24330, partial [Planctomycetes bacterium]|nr:hypothetical protein [Planctomycetota bacterium]
MNKLLAAVSSLALAALSANALAQTNATLIGVTGFTATLAQSRHAPCATLPTCVPPGMPASPGVRQAGGTAYDGTNDSIWITTGQLLGRYAG